MKVLLLNDNSAHPNWGAQATPFAIQQILRSRIPDCKIRTLTWDWIRMERRTPRTKMLGGFQIRLDAVPHLAFLVRKLTRPVESYPQVQDDFEWFANQWSTGQMGRIADSFVALARWADVVVYNGENNLYRNTVEGCRSIFLLYLAKGKLGKPACAVNHTVHITTVRPIMKSMIESVFPGLDLVSTREVRSYRALQRLGVTNARSGADVVFALTESSGALAGVTSWLSDRNLSSKAYACLSASGLPTSRPRGDYDGAFTDLARALGRTLRMPVVLVARDPSCRFLEDVARRTGSPFFGPEHHFSELWPLFRNASVLVTGHYHYAIIAAISGCPFVPLSVVNHKMSGLCEQLGWERTDPFDITQLRPVLQDVCTEALGHVLLGDALRERLAARAAELGQLALATGDWVHGSVGAARSRALHGEALT